MPSTSPSARFRFGVFEADATSGELRRQGIRVRVHVQPFQLLMLLLARPGEVLTREEIARELWPEGTFVDFEHGVNSAVNRLREALNDKAKSPRYVETLARRGYRFVAPVERIDAVATGETALPAELAGKDERASKPGVSDRGVLRDEASPVSTEAVLPVPSEEPAYSRYLASAAELPRVQGRTATTLFVLLQLMYLGFYVGALANLPEIEELLAALTHAPAMVALLVLSAALLILVRVFLVSAVLFRAPGFRARFLTMWPFLLVADVLWSLAPFLLLHHIDAGVALACMAPLVYAPFAERSLMLMGAGGI